LDRVAAGCDVGSYGLTPTGKTCSGECSTGADCCELPTNVGTIGATAVHTCQDILTSVLSGNTSQCTQSPTYNSAIGIGCFYYATYCSTCAANDIWSCTANKCVYNHSCQNTANVLNGCPTESRTGVGLTSTCDVASNTCKSATVAGTCSVDADCDGKTVADEATYTCRGGSCTCYAQNGGPLGCYLKCANDLDCCQGYECDAAGTKLCVENSGCSTDADCTTQTGMVNAKCSMGSCKTTCKTDHDCSASGVVSNPVFGGTSFSGDVCGADGFCAPLGCASDTDCENSGTGVSTLPMFCVTPATAPAVTVHASAVMN
jgi:hypothetical protein